MPLPGGGGSDTDCHLLASCHFPSTGVNWSVPSQTRFTCELAQGHLVSFIVVRQGFEHMVLHSWSDLPTPIALCTQQLHKLIYLPITSRAILWKNVMACLFVMLPSDSVCDKICKNKRKRGTKMITRLRHLPY